jgi:hypothetical protein
MKINSLTVDFMGQSVTLVKPQPKWQTAGDIWELATYIEVGKSAPGDSNFCAVTLVQSAGGAGGQSNWLLLKQPELQLLKTVNGINDQKDARWMWLAAPRGSVYLLLDGESEQDATQLRWPRIVIGSKADGERNLVKVIGAGMDEEGTLFARIAGIPQSADYSQYTLEKTPWFFHNIYCIYQKPNLRIGYTPQGAIYMPIFDPASGFKVSLGPKELWIDALWLKRKINP